MQRFSRRQMLREYAGEMKSLRVILLSFLSAGVIALWILYIQKEERLIKDVWLFAALPVALGLFILGLFLVLTGDGRLLRRTPYGKALSAWGDPAKLMAEIDRAAREGAFFPRFALLDGWLILFYPSPTRQDKGRICARPVPAREIVRVCLRRAKSGVIMSVQGKEAFGEVLLSDPLERSAVAQWLRAQEMEAIWDR